MSGCAWTEDRIVELTKLYEEGYSCSQIAAMMAGGLTRNAVIGKVHRLGLAKRGAGNHPPKDIRNRARREYPTPKPRLAKIKTSALFTQEQARSLRCIEVEPLHIALMDLEHGHCRWPYGEGPFTHCGHPKFAASSYCPAHFFLSVGTGTASERAATKVSTVHLEPFA